MTETSAVVVRVEHGVAHVEVGARQAGCGRCNEPGGCGAGSFAGQGSQLRRCYRVANDIDAQVGDNVMLTIPEGALLRASLVAYLLPATLLIAGAALGMIYSDTYAMLGAAIGLSVGAILLRHQQSRLVAAKEPILSLSIKRCAHHLQKENLC